jgi:RND family efflux transporter MFP subunit
MRLSRRVLLISASGSFVLVGVIGAISLLHNDHGEKGGSAVVPTYHTADVSFRVRTAIARAGTLVQHLTTSGTLRARREVEMQARVAGTLTRVPAFNGRHVQCGDTLATMDRREYRVAFERARAGLLNAQIEYRTLSTTPFLAATDSAETIRRISLESSALDSLCVLHTSGRLDDASYERLSREREAAVAYLTSDRGDVIAGRSGLAAAREAFETAKLNLEWTAITAPFDGRVADCLLTAGMHVNTGQSLLKLLDLSTLLVDAEVLENEIGRVAVGQPARILPVGLPGKECTGTVLYLNPLVDPKAKTMMVTIALGGGRRQAGRPSSILRPGMFATVHIETEILPDRLLVPRAALLIRDGRSLVFIVEHGIAKWHYVETGESNDELLEIRSGIATGDTVIVDGHYTLAHDAPVTVIRQAP